ncbi:globin-coupled sensor protein [Halobaculum halobium]|uniref:Globin-coupled sensor protein n=1 Tax=Halobaculum halobium TaxID=3032281 RepID=A0ABD5TIK4_9EURY|nr:globin-coupled sensor protein [Halobaculum sp. SYNS20]
MAGTLGYMGSREPRTDAEAGGDRSRATERRDDAGRADDRTKQGRHSGTQTDGGVAGAGGSPLDGPGTDGPPGGSSGFMVSDADRRGVDGADLAARLGLDEADIRKRKRYSRLSPSDEETLSSLEPLLEDLAPALVDEFYDHFTDHEETNAIFGRSSKGIEALKRTQRQYLTDLAGGDYGEDYFQRRARIGKLHDMLDLGPRVYFSGYSIYYEGLMDALADEARSEAGVEPASPGDDALARFTDRLLPLLKLLLLDQQVAMDTYIDSYVQQMETEIERRRELTDEVTREVEAPLDDIGDAAAGVASNADELAGLAELQADRMADAEAEVGTLSANVEEVAASAEQVAQVSGDAETLAEEGVDAAGDARDTMEDIEAATDEVTDDLDDLRERVGEIDEVVSVLDGIADQTNLLALNANIEAARAGEAGDGFAVVADEVKSLAEESQQRAGEIESLVENIQTGAEDTVESLERTEERIQDGVDRVDEAMERLDSIAEAIREAASGVEEVARAADSQASTTEAVASLVEEASTEAAAVRRNVEEIADAADDQRVRLDRVSDAVGRLTDESSQ